MEWFHILALVSLSLCLVSCAFHLIRLIRLGKPDDLAENAGNSPAAVYYSFTGGMSPTKKESAYLHLPTYVAGLVYHLGTFLSIALFFLFWIVPGIEGVIQVILIGFMSISAFCGIGIFIKRIYKKELRALSNPDDYISNFLVTLFQVVTLISLSQPAILYYFVASLLLLYLPLGKLKHTLYFFAARYHLGIFYGRLGVWPPEKQDKIHGTTIREEHK